MSALHFWPFGSAVFPSPSRAADPGARGAAGRRPSGDLGHPPRYPFRFAVVRRARLLWSAQDPVRPLRAREPGGSVCAPAYPGSLSPDRPPTGRAPCQATCGLRCRWPPPDPAAPAGQVRACLGAGRLRCRTPQTARPHRAPVWPTHGWVPPRPARRPLCPLRLPRPLPCRYRHLLGMRPESREHFRVRENREDAKSSVEEMQEIFGKDTGVEWMMKNASEKDVYLDDVEIQVKENDMNQLKRDLNEMLLNTSVHTTFHSMKTEQGRLEKEFGEDAVVSEYAIKQLNKYANEQHSVDDFYDAEHIYVFSYRLKDVDVALVRHPEGGARKGEQQEKRVRKIGTQFQCLRTFEGQKHSQRRCVYKVMFQLAGFEERCALEDVVDECEKSYGLTRKAVIRALRHLIHTGIIKNLG